ncbi:hypothetical protein C4F49_10060 [Sphingobacterium sp. KB22]|uniref:Uncharacterized protein n=1 Tax=Sphingobacterium hungaricum TaxID=2082723 RepID=A0A928UW30_9SPHI|nr:hypothetical protein [Sphingobacterium hungaricum]
MKPLIYLAIILIIAYASLRIGQFNVGILTDIVGICMFIVLVIIVSYWIFSSVKDLNKPTD